MSRPNSQRRRICVDVGERCWWLLDELLHALPHQGRYGARSMVSDIVRLALEELAKDRLQPHVLAFAPPGDGDLNCKAGVVGHPGRGGNQNER